MACPGTLLNDRKVCSTRKSWRGAITSQRQLRIVRLAHAARIGKPGGQDLGVRAIFALREGEGLSWRGRGGGGGGGRWGEMEL